jgi:hypothetical protein
MASVMAITAFLPPSPVNSRGSRAVHEDRVGPPLAARAGRFDKGR